MLVTFGHCHAVMYTHHAWNTDFYENVSPNSGAVLSHVSHSQSMHPHFVGLTSCVWISNHVFQYLWVCLPHGCARQWGVSKLAQRSVWLVWYQTVGGVTIPRGSSWRRKPLWWSTSQMYTVITSCLCVKFGNSTEWQVAQEWSASAT